MTGYEPCDLEGTHDGGFPKHMPESVMEPSRDTDLLVWTKHILLRPQTVTLIVPKTPT